MSPVRIRRGTLELAPQCLGHKCGPCGLGPWLPRARYPAAFRGYRVQLTQDRERKPLHGALPEGADTQLHKPKWRSYG